MKPPFHSKIHSFAPDDCFCCKLFNFEISSRSFSSSSRIPLHHHLFELAYIGAYFPKLDQLSLMIVSCTFLLTLSSFNIYLQYYFLGFETSGAWNMIVRLYTFFKELFIWWRNWRDTIFRACFINRFRHYIKLDNFYNTPIPYKFHHVVLKASWALKSTWKRCFLLWWQEKFFFYFT